MSTGRQGQGVAGGDGALEGEQHGFRKAKRPHIMTVLYFWDRFSFEPLRCAVIEIANLRQVE